MPAWYVRWNPAEGGGSAGMSLALLAAQLGQRVLQHLDQPLNVL